MNRIRKLLISKSAALNLIITLKVFYRKDNSQWISPPPPENVLSSFLRSLPYQHCMVKITLKDFSYFERRRRDIFIYHIHNYTKYNQQ